MFPPEPPQMPLSHSVSKEYPRTANRGIAGACVCSIPTFSLTFRGQKEHTRRSIEMDRAIAPVVRQCRLVKAGGGYICTCQNERPIVPKEWTGREDFNPSNMDQREGKAHLFFNTACSVGVGVDVGTYTCACACACKLLLHSTTKQS